MSRVTFDKASPNKASVNKPGTILPEKYKKKNLQKNSQFEVFSYHVKMKAKHQVITYLIAYDLHLYRPVIYEPPVDLVKNRAVCV